ncbi:toxin-antitoxin system YwqK family antitoxin [Cellulophaga baltica]|uniref:toxin-antitoxin system YwqK family antitoxin n=1 Tax=Cellulophaga baltica TaxID=76594 RepID=UPI0020C8A2DE|nr:toxin-antitoxin system YwqK family antitoxin [Cellulophaga baltica]
MTKSVVIFIVFVASSIFTISCNQKNNEEKISSENLIITSITIPNLSVDKALITYDNKTSTFLINEEPFSGYMISFYEDGTPKEKIGIFNGKKQNKSSYWFSNGKLKQIATYNKGKLHGEKKLWSNDSMYTLVAHLNYNFGKVDGQQKQWYKTGELYKILNLSMGKEDGIQQAFRKNGDLYANYEAKNGRIFGLKKSALCYGLEDEKIKKYEK